MPIHYEKRDDHIVVITIDRPEGAQRGLLHHFRDLAGARRTSATTTTRWLAIITGVPVGLTGCVDLKTYIPQITDLATKIGAGEVTEIYGCRLDDCCGTRAVLRERAGLTGNRSSPRSTDRAWPAAWRCSACVDIRIATPNATFGVLEPSRGVCSPEAGRRRLPRQVRDRGDCSS